MKFAKKGILGKVKCSTIVECFFLSILSLCSIVLYEYGSVNGLTVCILILLFNGVLYILRDGLADNITLAAFLLTYFTFLLTRVVFPLFFNTDELVLNLGETAFNEEIDLFVNMCLFVSLLFVYIGYRSNPRNNADLKDNRITFNRLKSISRVRRFSKRAAVIFSIFALISILDQIRYVLHYGYMDFYLNYKANVPYLIIFMASFFEYFVIFYLATMPTKKESQWIISLYLFVNILSMGMGQRGGAVVSIIFIITYYFLRNKIDPGAKPWISRKGIISIIILFPVFVSFLFLVAFIRTEKEIETQGTTNLVVSFFYQQGVSINVLGYTKQFEDILPEGKLYSAGKIVDFINHNAISQILFDKDPVKPQTTEHALEDHTLHATLTYYGSPSLYFSGGGYGGCYIADLYADFGYIGIIIGSFILGICLANIKRWCTRSFWLTSAGLLMYTRIIMAPRANFIDFIYVFVPFTAIISYAIIFCVKNNFLQQILCGKYSDINKESISII